MTFRLSIVERASIIARSGSVANIGELRKQLTREGYDQVGQHFSSQTLGREIRKMIVEAIAANSEDA